MKLHGLLQGKPGTVPRYVAGILTAASLAVFGFIVLPIEEELAIADTEFPRADTMVRGGDERQEQYIAGFPILAQTPDAVHAVAGAARESGVDLSRGEYRIAGGGQTDQLLRYEMVFPVQASYPQIRAFVTRTLAALPYVAVDSITFERRQAAETQVNARIKFTLFLRRTAA